MTSVYPSHFPVLKNEIGSYLIRAANPAILDLTLGLGGHAEHLLSLCDDQAIYLGIDRDQEALTIAQEKINRDSRFHVIHVNHDDLWSDDRFTQFKEEMNLDGFNFILCDLGISSFQLKTPERGFSFSKIGPLDMRMDKSQGPTALEWIQRQDEETLAYAIWIYGEERASRPIAKSIMKSLNEGSLKSTDDLAQAIYRVIPKAIAKRRGHIDPATRTFQAIRIAVNGELDRLSATIEKAFHNLKVGGRLAIISFHSLEDRIVKQTFRRLSGIYDGPGRMAPQQLIKLAEILEPKGITPSEAEISSNPSSRSARLRIAERIQGEVL